MLKKIFVITIIGLFFVSCGKKNDPEYKSDAYKSNAIHIV